MKEELEELGFKERSYNYILKINNALHIGVGKGDKEVWLCNSSYSETLFLFPYDLEKLKQLINLLK